MVDKFIICSLLLFCALQPAVFANPILMTDYKKCGTAKNVTVISGDTISLSSDEIIRLADIKAPELWSKNTAYKSWPYAYQSKQALQRLLSQKEISLYCGKQKSNFLGESIRHVVIEGHKRLWVQEYMIAQGYAFLFPSSKSSAEINELYTIEDHAKLNKIGLWKTGTYKVIAALNTDKIRSGWFQIIRGKVHAAKKVKGKLYLNFEENWREDFTIEISGKILRALKKQGTDPLNYEGKTVEVRGWVEWAGGPKIILSSSNRIRLITSPN